METNNIKNIWKQKVESDITPYSDTQLTDMILISARKTMRIIQPHGIFRWVIIGIIIFLIGKVSSGKYGYETQIMDGIALFTLSVCYILWERSAYIMNKYTWNMPIKNWLEYRIHQVEKKVRFTARYNILVNSIVSLIGCSIWLIPQLLTKTINWIALPITFTLTVILLLIISNRTNKNYKKTLCQLKELQKQLEEY